MKIYNPNSPKTVKFDTLEAGVVFKFDCVYYMKMKARGTPSMPFNAVSLLSGIAIGISSNAQVVPVSGEFVVKKVNA